VRAAQCTNYSRWRHDSRPLVAACGDRFLLVDADDPARSRDLVPAGVFPANSSLTLAIALDERHIALIPGRPTATSGRRRSTDDREFVNIRLSPNPGAMILSAGTASPNGIRPHYSIESKRTIRRTVAVSEPLQPH
jgi:hypothetical protein